MLKHYVLHAKTQAFSAKELFFIFQKCYYRNAKSICFKVFLPFYQRKNTFHRHVKEVKA